MNRTKWILRAVTVCCILIPILFVGYTYRDNVLGLILPPQVLELMSNSNGSDINSTITQLGINPDNLHAPQIVDFTFNNQTGVADLTLNFTNPMTNQSIDVNSFSVDVSYSNGTQFTIQLNQPIDIAPGQTGNITLSTSSLNAQTEAFLDSVINGNQTIDPTNLQFSNLNVDVSGIIVHVSNVGDLSSLFGGNSNNNNNNNNNGNNNGNNNNGNNGNNNNNNGNNNDNNNNDGNNGNNYNYNNN